MINEAHMSGPFSGQVPNQAGNQLPGLLQPNGNSFHTQVQKFNGQNNPSVMDSEVLRIRQFMRDHIYEKLMLRQSQPNEALSKRCQDVTKRLEDLLFKSSTTKEEYMNMNTLETRLQALFKRPTPTNHVAQHSQYINATIPGATMMPTPGMPQNGNPNVNVSSAVAPTMMASGTDGSMSSSIPNTGSLMQIHQPMMTDEHTNELITDRTSLAGNLSHEHVQEEFRHLSIGNDEAPCINLSSEVSSNGQIVAPGSIVDQPRLA